MANTKKQTKRKYHTVYQITNLLNNKIYIGVHSTDNLNDEYYGSGTNITRALEKYGRKSFKKELLYIFETPQEMLLKEKELVTLEFLKRSDVYNIVEGGYGGYNKGSTGLKHLHHPLTNERCAVHPNAVDKMLQEGWKIGRNTSPTKNSIWIYKNTEKKMIDPAELHSYSKEGWQKGLPKSPTHGKVWIHHPISNEYSLCEINDLETKLSNGWRRQKWAPVKKGTTWINNGVKNLRIFKNEIDLYISKGWVKGMITSL
jgi:hypothetical protein